MTRASSVNEGSENTFNFSVHLCEYNYQIQMYTITYQQTLDDPMIEIIMTGAPLGRAGSGQNYSICVQCTK